MKQLFLIGLGGFLGSISRYGVATWTKGWTENFPAGTFIVNLLGSFLIGLILGLSIKPNGSVHWFFVVGFCGGFTTFSTFAMENVNLIKSGLWSPAMIYSVLSLVLGIILCLVGTWLGDKLV